MCLLCKADMAILLQTKNGCDSGTKSQPYLSAVPPSLARTGEPSQAGGWPKSQRTGCPANGGPPKRLTGEAGSRSVVSSGVNFGWLPPGEALSQWPLLPVGLRPTYSLRHSFYTCYYTQIGVGVKSATVGPTHLIGSGRTQGSPLR